MDTVLVADTPLRTVRVPTDLWEAALECARRQGESLSTVIRRLIADYVADSARMPPAGPPAAGTTTTDLSAERLVQPRQGTAFLIAQGMIMQRLGLDEEEAARFLESPSGSIGDRSHRA